MIKHCFPLMVLCAFLLISCLPAMMANPEWQKCTKNCVIQKNTCMIEATTTEKITECDEAIRGCYGTCSNIPARIPIKQ